MYAHTCNTVNTGIFNFNLAYIKKKKEVPCIMTEIFLYFVTPQTKCNFSPGLRHVKVIEPVQN